MKDYTIYVTEDIAKKAMEMGFKLKSIFVIEEDTKYFISSDFTYYLIPTAEQICGWLREEKNIYFEIHYYYRQLPSTWHCRMFSSKNITKHMCGVGNLFSTYEEALLEGINKALDLI